MGAHRGFKEALFSTLISADFLQNLSKFCSEDTQREPEDLWMPLCKSSKNLLPPSRPPRGSPKSPTISLKNFQYFLAPPISTPYIWHLYIRGTNIRCTSKHRPGHKTARECTANSAVNPAANSVVNPVMDSTVHLR